MLAGKTALITGSTSGIGLGVAESLARCGANIVLNGSGNAQGIEETEFRLRRERNIGVIYNAADMTRPTEIADMIEAAIKAFGSVDILINNAGIQHVAPVEEFPSEKWDAIIAVSLTAAFHTTRYVVPLMKRQRWGRIVNIASAHGLVASPFKSAYVAAKHGLVGLTKAVALELATYSVTVNAVCPGYVLTPLVQQQIPEQAAARGISEEDVVRNVLLAAQPTKRFVTVAEIASLVQYLCSDDAQSITGAILPMDGGWTAE